MKVKNKKKESDKKMIEKINEKVQKFLKEEKTKEILEETKYRYVFECQICGKEIEPKFRKKKAFCEFHTLKPMRKIKKKLELKKEIDKK